MNEMAFVGPCPPPLGGVAIANLNAQRLFSDDCDIECFNTSKGGVREDLYGKKGIAEVFAGIKQLFRYIAFSYSAKSDIFNIFVTSNISFIRGALFLLIAKLFKKKIIVHLHSKMAGELFLSRPGLRVMAIVFRLCDAVIVLSKEHKAFFSLYFRHCRLEVLENFVFKNDFEPIHARQEIEFLYVGRLTEKKGFYDLLEAVNWLKPFSVRIHVMGLAETAEKEKEIIELVNRYGIVENFIFHGLKYGEEKFSIYKRCSVFIFPSHFENSPVVLKEAMAARQVIICSDIDANKNILKDMRSVCYFPKGDINSLASIIRQVVKDKSYYSELVSGVSFPPEAGDRYAKLRFNSIVEQI